MRFPSSLVLVVLLCPTKGVASECLGFPTSHMLRWNEGVFIGEVVSITSNGRVDEIGLRVKRTFKFNLPRRGPFVLSQWARTGTTDYGHRFAVGSEYLVFARDNVAGDVASAPPGFISRSCDQLDSRSSYGRNRISELQVLIRNRQFGRGVSR